MNLVPPKQNVVICSRAYHKKGRCAVLLPMVISIGSIPKVLDTSLVKVDTTTFVYIISLMLIPRALSILNGITFVIDPLSINTFVTAFPLTEASEGTPHRAEAC